MVLFGFSQILYNHVLPKGRDSKIRLSYFLAYLEMVRYEESKSIALKTLELEVTKFDLKKFD